METRRARAPVQGWRLALCLAVVAPIVTSLPYVGHLLATPAGKEYLGLKAVNGADQLTYVMWMRQARLDTFFLRDLYTTEDGGGAIAVPFFWLLGLASRAFHLPPMLALHGARVVFGAALILACFWFVSLYLAGAMRTRAFLLLSLGTGLPGLIPEASPISAIYDSALPPAAWSLVLLSLGMYGQALHGTWARSAMAGGVAAVLAVVHPYDAITVAAVASIATCWPGGGLALGARLHCLSLFLLTFLPGVAFTAYNTLGSPVARAWAASPRPTAWWCYLSFGVLWIGALWALVRQRRNLDRLLLAWLGAGIILTLIPSPFSRRLLLGLQAPLSIIATIGFASIMAHRARLARLMEATFYPGSIVMLLLDPTLHLMGVQPLLHVPEAIAQDIRDLATLPPAPVLADPGWSYLIPALSGLPVHCGHYDMTLDFERKRGDWQRFLDGTWGVQDLASAGIGYVVAPCAVDADRLGVTLVRKGRSGCVFRPGTGR